MKLTMKIDGNCPACHGKGQVIDGQQRADGYWISVHQCYCVEYEHDDEMKAFLKRVATRTDLETGNG